MKTVRLVPYTPDINTFIMGWAEKLENTEFFRRFPPKCDWLEASRMAQVFGNTWVLYEEEKPVGLVLLHSFDQFGRSCEFGLLVDFASSEHPHQTAHEATNQVCDYVFNYRNLHKIYMKILDNRDLLKTRLESVGFTHEATLRDSIFFNGEYRNEYLLGCLKLEFVQRTPGISYKDSKVRVAEAVKKVKESK